MDRDDSDAMRNAASIIELLARAEVILARVKELRSPGKPLLVRLWNMRRAAVLINEADYLLEQATQLQGLHLPPEKRPWYVPGRRRLLVLQWVTGTANAYSAIGHLASGRYLFAAASVFCIWLCAMWVIPRK